MKRFLLPILLTSPTAAFADDGFTLSASSRIRYETIENQPRAGFNEADDLLNVRTIVTGEYRDGPTAPAHLSVTGERDPQSDPDPLRR